MCFQFPSRNLGKGRLWGGEYFISCFYTVVVDYINKMKTTFGYNFDFNQALKQHGYTKTWKHREVLN